MNGFVHSARANYFETDTTWRLMPEALDLRARRLCGELPPMPRSRSSDFRTDPTRADAARYRCDVDGGAAYHTDPVQPLRRPRGFRGSRRDLHALVRELVVRVAAVQPALHIPRRQGAADLLGRATFFLLAMAALLVTVLLLVGGYGLSELVWLKLAIVIGLVPLRVRLRAQEPAARVLARGYAARPARRNYCASIPASLISLPQVTSSP